MKDLKKIINIKYLKMPMNNDDPKNIPMDNKDLKKILINKEDLMKITMTI